MKVIKKINNNVAVCLDSREHELIAFGNGIGFPKTPYELTELTKITRTFYGINENYLPLLNEISEDIFNICVDILDKARNAITSNLSSNVLFTLADHINFAIERTNKGITVELPLYYELEHLYEIEVDLGKYALQEIRKQLHVFLAEGEAYSIALHLINAQEKPCVQNSSSGNDDIINQVTNIIEGNYHMVINRTSFNYSRFVSHMQYLLKRKTGNISIVSDNERIFQNMKEEFPQSYTCALNIQKYFVDAMNWHPSEEELLYLMLHINRLCVREDCNQ